MNTTETQNKSTAFKLSEQVKKQLHEKGYSFLFNYSDYDYYKKQAKNTFNKVQSITSMFISDNQNAKSDYNKYVF